MRDLAERYAPTFYQEVKTVDDLIVPINFGAQIQADPVGYYAVRRIGDYTVCYYHVYHYRDRGHRHDFEGTMVVADEFGEIVRIASRAHYGRPVMHDELKIRILAGSHAQVRYKVPWWRKLLGVPDHIVYAEYELRDMLHWTEKQRLYIQDKFGIVDLPWRIPYWWSDPLRLVGISLNRR